MSAAFPDSRAASPPAVPWPLTPPPTPRLLPQQRTLGSVWGTHGTVDPGACPRPASQASCLVPVSPAVPRDLVPPFGGGGGTLGCPSTRIKRVQQVPVGSEQSLGTGGLFLGVPERGSSSWAARKLVARVDSGAPPAGFTLPHSRCARQPDFCALPLTPTPALPCPSPLPQLHRADAAGRERHTPVLPQVWRPDV